MTHIFLCLSTLQIYKKNYKKQIFFTFFSPFITTFFLFIYSRRYFFHGARKRQEFRYLIVDRVSRGVWWDTPHFFVGWAGFEPTTSCSQSRHSNRTELPPEINRKQFLGYRLKVYSILKLLYVSLLTPIRDSNPCLPLHEGTLVP